MHKYYSSQDDISFTPFTRDEEKQLFLRYQASPDDNNLSADSLQARDEIVARHLKLIAKLSLYYAKGALREDDAISAGNAGLMQALRPFNAGSGFLFSSYVRSYVKGQVFAALRDKGWKGHPSEEDESLEYAPEATITGRDGGEDLLSHSGKSYSVVAFSSRRLTNLSMVESTIEHAGEENQLGEFRRGAIEAALAKLPELEASTIRAHFFGDRNFADVGRERKLTREGVRKAFNRGMEKLREILAENKEELL